jgi:hypothetical protein
MEMLKVLIANNLELYFPHFFLLANVLDDCWFFFCSNVSNLLKTLLYYGGQVEVKRYNTHCYLWSHSSSNCSGFLLGYVMMSFEMIWISVMNGDIGNTLSCWEHLKWFAGKEGRDMERSKVFLIVYTRIISSRSA